MFGVGVGRENVLARAGPRTRGSKFGAEMRIMLIAVVWGRQLIRAACGSAVIVARHAFCET
jgi:hypothetical protein